MLRDELGVLASFAVVAEERSFTRAAVRIGVSTSALSHAIEGLEERLGLRLLAHTTRTVAPTEAGERLLAQLRPALDDIEAAVTDLGRLRDRSAGVVRLIAPPMAVAMGVMPRLAEFTREYPDVLLDVTTVDDSDRDLVAGRFDAGIHLGEFVQRDTVAVRVTGRQRAGIVAAPSYFEDHPPPKSPRHLTAHTCIRYRMRADGPVYRWEFEKRGRPVTVSVSDPLVISDADLTLRAARDGLGLAYALEEYVAESLARGDLVRVLEDRCPPLRRLLPLPPEPPPPAARAPGAGRHHPGLTPGPSTLRGGPGGPGPPRSEEPQKLTFTVSEQTDVPASQTW